MDDLDSNFSEEDYGGEYVNPADEYNEQDERDEMETIHELIQKQKARRANININIIYIIYNNINKKKGADKPKPCLELDT